MRHWRLSGLLAALALIGAVIVPSAAAAAEAFLLYPNYRGLIFDDRPEIVVEAPSGASVTVTDKAGGGTVASVTSPGPKVTIPAGGLTHDRDYVVTVRAGGADLGRWDVRLVSASRRQSMRISFDAKGRVLVNGVPRFLLGVYDSGMGYVDSVSAWEQMLFASGGKRQLGGIPINLYLNYWYGQAPLPAMLALMDALQRHGVLYLQTANCFDTGSYTRIPFAVDQSESYVQTFGAHAGAAGYYIADECRDPLIPETRQHHERLKRLDPDSMTLAVTLARGYIDPRKWVDAADVIGTDPYPLFGAEPAQGYSHFQVADFVAQLKDALRDTRPALAVLQLFKFTSNSRLPTRAEYRAHAIMSIVEGARGLMWWEVGDNGLRKSSSTPEQITTHMGYLKELVSELAALEPVLLADDVPGALTGNSTRYSDPVAGRIAQLRHNIAVEWLESNKDWYRAELARLQAGDTSRSPMLPGAATIRTKVKIVDGKGYVFAYNYTNQPTPVTFTWHVAPGRVTEYRDGRSFPISGSSWSDTFGPYDSRIYVIANGGPGGGSGGTTPPPPSSSLSVSFTNPAAGATVSGTTTVTMTASGGSGYTFRLAVDGTQVYVGANPSFAWNTTAVSNGGHTLTATVTDGAGRTATATRAVTVANGTGGGSTPPPPTPPPVQTASFTVSFSYPSAGATVKGTQSVGMATTAPWGSPKTFRLLANGVEVARQAMSTGSTWWVQWDSKAVADGAVTLTATVTDGAGKVAVATRAVTVANGTGGGSTPPPSTTPLTAGFSAPTAGTTVSGTTTVTMTASGGSGYTFRLAVDGTQVYVGANPSFAWNTTAVSNGSHTLTATVTDGAGRTATATRAVTVANATSTPPPVQTASFTVSFSYPSAGATVKGTQSVGMATTAPWGSPKTFRLLANGVEVARQAMSTGSTWWVQWDSKAVADGAVTLTATVTDGAGKVAVATRAVTVANGTIAQALPASESPSASPAPSPSPSPSPSPDPPAAVAMGPLKVHPSNPRYFMDGGGRPVLLTGSHTWSSLVDIGTTDPPEAFDFEAYLDRLEAENHTFIRLWTWELTRHLSGSTSWSRPHPWVRSGPGTALDGKPKFDLSRFDQAYFDRLRQRVLAARDRGIYVSVMLFEGWGVQRSSYPWRWDGHPFNAHNNINGVNGDPDGDGLGTEIHTLAVPAVRAIQEAYVRKVIDTVGDLDNVLYEIANEAGPYSTEWQYHMVRFVKSYEAGKPKQHPVGMTFQYAGGSNSTLYASPADWISPNSTASENYQSNPPAADGRKVVLSDTDHLWGVGGDRTWVWKSFLRGLNPIYMDPLDADATREGARRAMGQVRAFSERLDLVGAVPRNALASSGYCLCKATATGAQYLVYAPGGSVTVNLSATGGTLLVEWFNPATGATTAGQPVSGGGSRSFTAPFGGDAVLFLRSA